MNCCFDFWITLSLFRRERNPRRSMTKYILVGGYPHKATDGGKALCEELVRGFGESVRILDCLFARPREIWEESYG